MLAPVGAPKKQRTGKSFMKFPETVSAVVTKEPLDGTKKRKKPVRSKGTAKSLEFHIKVHPEVLATAKKRTRIGARFVPVDNSTMIEVYFK